MTHDHHSQESRTLTRKIKAETVACLAAAHDREREQQRMRS